MTDESNSDGAKATERVGSAELLRQHQVLAKFGELALNSDALDEILTEACRLVGEALGTDLAKVVELQEDGETLFVRAGVGWKPGVVGVVKLRLDERSSEGHALKTGEPMISSDIDKETRFHYADFLKDNGVKAIVNVAIIGGVGRPPFGILQVDSRKPREFSETDILFLRSYANLLAASVSRLRALEEARSKNVQLGHWLEECRRSAERQQFLSKELDHRAKNILAVVSAVVRLTQANDLPTFAKVIDGRVAAMARAHTILSADQWSGADLHKLLRGELSAYLDGAASGPQAELYGPPVTLPAQVAQAFSIAIHELATNAVKYGALSSPTGRLAVAWHVERAADDVLRFRWTETGGPAIQGPPARRGFGSRALTNIVRSQLGGTIHMAWGTTGLVCDFAVPLRATEPEAVPGEA